MLFTKTQEYGNHCFGEGTAPSKLLEVMGINEIQKKFL